MKYVIFGDGRVGANMAAYLEGLGHSVDVVPRRKAEEAQETCAALIERADIVATAIPDDRLPDWREEWKTAIGARPAIHFSGAVDVKGMHAFHPLYSFPKSLIDPAIMKGVVFACPLGGPAFQDMFPGAPNPHFEIAGKDRARYHALAVLSGNLVGYIWNETAKDIAACTGLSPEQALGSYLRSILDRFHENPTASLTGPVARRDRSAVKENLAALSESPKLERLYRAFLEAAWPEYKE